MAKTTTLYIPGRDVLPLVQAVAQKHGIKAILSLMANGTSDGAKAASVKFGGGVLGKGQVWVRAQESLGFGGDDPVPQNAVDAVLAEAQAVCGEAVHTMSEAAIALLKSAPGLTSPLRGAWSVALQRYTVGGRQELFYRRAEVSRIVKLDQRGSYPAILANAKLPWGRGLEVVTLDDEAFFGGQVDYFLICDVEVEGDPGPLPYRAASGQLCYPKGRWTGGFWLSELQHAGITPIKTHKAWMHPVSDQGQHLGRAVLEARERSDFRGFWKGVGVRMVGMLGQVQGAPKCFVLESADDVLPGDVLIDDTPGCVIVQRPGPATPRDWTRLPAYSRILSLCRQETRRMLETTEEAGMPALFVHTDGLWIDASEGSLPTLWGNWRKDADHEGDLRVDAAGAGTWKIHDRGRRLDVASAMSGYRDSETEGRICGAVEPEGLRGGRLPVATSDLGYLPAFQHGRTIQPVIDDLNPDPMSAIRA